MPGMLAALRVAPRLDLHLDLRISRRTSCPWKVDREVDASHIDVKLTGNQAGGAGQHAHEALSAVTLTVKAPISHESILYSPREGKCHCATRKICGVKTLMEPLLWRAMATGFPSGHTLVRLPDDSTADLAVADRQDMVIMLPARV
jgi:hypothetical protein